MVRESLVAFARLLGDTRSYTKDLATIADTWTMQSKHRDKVTLFRRVYTTLGEQLAQIEEQIEA